MKYVYVEFYDLVYASAWDEEALEIEDTIHIGIGILLEDKPTHITIAMAIGNNPKQPFSRLLIPRQMIIKSVEFDSNMFTDRLMIDGYGRIDCEKEASHSYH